MNSKRRTKSGERSIVMRVFFAGVLLCGYLPPKVAKAGSGEKSNTLFMGADVSVAVDKGVYAVEDVIGSSWVVEVDGRTRVIPSKEGTTTIKITPSLKITGVSVNVANLKSVRGFTFGNDPSVRLTRSLTQTAVENADFHDAQDQAIAAQNVTIASAQTRASLEDKNNIYDISHRNPVIKEALDSAQNNLTDTNDQVGSDLSVGRNHPLTDGVDAMEVNFDVSSGRRLQNPYVVTITRFHPKDGAAGIVQVLVYARSLNPIDSHPTNVHFIEGGFPANFELVDFQMHVYNAGVEVATSVSSKRVELTADEAFEYVKMEYIGAHPKETRPPEPAVGLLPVELPERVALGKYVGPYFVRVSKDGLADEVYLDAACTRKVGDASLDSLVKSIRFDPALSNGKAVEGIASVQLNQLKI